MKDLTFSEIENMINQVLSKNNLKPALELNISIRLTMKDHLKPNVILQIAQFEKNNEGYFIKHHVTGSGLDFLKSQFHQSVISKNA